MSSHFQSFSDLCSVVSRRQTLWDTDVGGFLHSSASSTGFKRTFKVAPYSFLAKHYRFNTNIDYFLLVICAKMKIGQKMFQGLEGTKKLIYILTLSVSIATWRFQNGHISTFFVKYFLIFFA